MKRLLLVFAALLLFCPTLRAQDGGYRTERAIAYRDAADPASADSLCRLDLYYPTDRPGFATVIWFHGGGLTGGRREIPAARFAARALPWWGWIIGWCRTCRFRSAWRMPRRPRRGSKNIADYGGDPRLIFVAGHSAGGYLTSMIGLDKRWLKPLRAGPRRGLRGPDPYSGQVVTHFARRAELGAPDTQPLVDDLAPLNHVRADCPPILILSGDRELEMLGRYEENAYFWRMMRVVGHPDVQLREFDGFDHGNMPQAGHYVAVRYIRERVKRLER